MGTSVESIRRGVRIETLCLGPETRRHCGLFDPSSSRSWPLACGWSRYETLRCWSSSKHSDRDFPVRLERTRSARYSASPSSDSERRPFPLRPYSLGGLRSAAAAGLEGDFVGEVKDGRRDRPTEADCSASDVEDEDGERAVRLLDDDGDDVAKARHPIEDKEGMKASWRCWAVQAGDDKNTETFILVLVAITERVREMKRIMAETSSDDLAMVESKNNKSTRCGRFSLW